MQIHIPILNLFQVAEEIKSHYDYRLIHKHRRYYVHHLANSSLLTRNGYATGVNIFEVPFAYFTFIFFGLFEI